MIDGWCNVDLYSDRRKHKERSLDVAETYRIRMPKPRKRESLVIRNLMDLTSGCEYRKENYTLDLRGSETMQRRR